MLIVGKIIYDLSFILANTDLDHFRKVFDSLPSDYLLLSYYYYLLLLILGVKSTLPMLANKLLHTVQCTEAPVDES